MTADELIAALEQQALLPPNVISTLRQFVTKSLKVVTSESLIELLIAKRWLTPPQVERLLKHKMPAPVAPVEAELGLADPDEPPAKRFGSAMKKTDDSLQAAAAGAAVAAKPRGPDKPSQSIPAGKSAARSGIKSSDIPTNPDSTSTDDPPPDDLFDGPDLEVALSGTQSGSLETARRRVPIPHWVWAVVAGSGAISVAIAAALILLNRSNGDGEWQLAEKDYSAGADRQAVAKLDAFLERFPDHPRASTAVVYRGVARLRLECSRKGNWENALGVAREELPRIVDQPDFTNVRDALSALLPEMAVGLAAEAKDGAKGPLDRRRRQVDAALAGLAMAKDPRFTADSKKPWALLMTTEDEVALLARAVDRETELDRAAAEIRAALAAGQVSAATARRDKLLESFPELQQDLTVEAINQELTQAQAANRKVNSDGQHPTESTAPSKSALSSPDEHPRHLP